MELFNQFLADINLIITQPLNHIIPLNVRVIVMNLKISFYVPEGNIKLKQKSKVWKCKNKA